VASAHALQHLAGCKQVTRRRRGFHVQSTEQDRHVTPEPVEAVTNQGQAVKVFRLSQSLHFGCALGKHIPRDDRLDGGEWIAARLLGVEQDSTDTSIEAYLGSRSPFWIAETGRRDCAWFC
jgi:hypothetical protein